MADLIPQHIQTGYYDPKFIGEPIKDIQDYHKEVRDKYAQVVSEQNTAYDALYNNKNVADIDKSQYNAHAKGIEDTLLNVAGAGGNYEDKLGQVRHLSNMAKANIDYYAERHKGLNETLKKQQENNLYDPTDKREQAEFTKTINTAGNFIDPNGGNGAIIAFEPTKPVSANELFQKAAAAAHPYTNEGGLKVIQIKDAQGNISGEVRQSTTTNGWHENDLNTLADLYVKNDHENNAFNNQQAQIKANSGTTAAWLHGLGVTQDEIKKATTDYYNNNRINPEDPKANYVAMRDIGLKLKQEHDIKIVKQALVAQHPISRTTQESGMPNGGGGAGDVNFNVNETPVTYKSMTKGISTQKNAKGKEVLGADGNPITNSVEADFTNHKTVGLAGAGGLTIRGHKVYNALTGDWQATQNTIRIDAKEATLKTVARKDLRGTSKIETGDGVSTFKTGQPISNSGINGIYEGAAHEIVSANKNISKEQFREEMNTKINDVIGNTYFVSGNTGEFVAGSTDNKKITAAGEYDVPLYKVGNQAINRKTLLSKNGTNERSFIENVIKNPVENVNVDNTKVDALYDNLKSKQGNSTKTSPSQAPANKEQPTKATDRSELGNQAKSIFQ